VHHNPHRAGKLYPAHEIEVAEITRTVVVIGAGPAGFGRGRLGLAAGARPFRLWCLRRTDPADQIRLTSTENARRAKN